MKIRYKLLWVLISAIALYIVFPKYDFKQDHFIIYRCNKITGKIDIANRNDIEEPSAKKKGFDVFKPNQ